MKIALLHAFPVFSPGISDLMTFVRFLDFPGPAEGPASINRSGHVLSSPSLWSQWIARTSRWSRQYVSTSIPKSRRLQCTSPADSPRKSIWDPIGHIHPPHFAFLNSKGDPGKLNGAGSTCPHRFPGAACPTPAHINVPGQQRRQRPT